jgi:hypothetical protein
MILLGVLAVFLAAALIVGLVVFIIWARKRGWQLKWIFGGAAVVVFSMIVGWRIYEYTQKPAPAPREAVEKRIEVMLYPNYYTEISLPAHHWGHFVTDKDFQVRLADGKMFNFLGGEKWPYLGDEIPDNKLELRSLTGEKIKIEIFLRKKIR